MLSLRVNPDSCSSSSCFWCLQPQIAIHDAETAALLQHQPYQRYRRFRQVAVAAGIGVAVGFFHYADGRDRCIAFFDLARLAARVFCPAAPVTSPPALPVSILLWPGLHAARANTASSGRTRLKSVMMRSRRVAIELAHLNSCQVNK